jgi:endonuclease YncB( thermonuclease family)
MRHWTPETARGAGPGGPRAYRFSRRGGPGRRHGGRIGGAELALMAGAGIALGLAAAMISTPIAPGPAPAPAPSVRPAPRPSPYAEAERSRALLTAQEGAPPPLRFAEAGRRAPAATRAAAVTVAPGAVRVIDGDTFAWHGMRVRIADIDAPETHPPRCAYEADLGARATARMRALLAAGPFELHPIPDGRDTDRYGRKLRIVTRGGRSLGDQLVGEGLARTWTGRREPWC